MAYELKRRMQNALDESNLRIVELNNALNFIKDIDQHEKMKNLRELERMMKRKGELESALQILGQYER